MDVPGYNTPNRCRVCEESTLADDDERGLGPDEAEGGDGKSGSVGEREEGICEEAMAGEGEGGFDEVDLPIRAKIR